jgi:adenylosuccinate synthase
MTTPSPVRLPSGVRDFLPRAAARRRAIAERLLSTFEAWGYARIIPPVFECADVLERGLGADGRAAAIRFVEPVAAEVVALRPDFTPQVARLAATRLADVGGPLRLCYEGAVHRLVGAGHGASTQREILQAGIELIGADGLDADAEAIALAAAALRAAGLTEVQLDLGHVGFATEALAAVEPAIRDAVALGLARKDRGAVARATVDLPPELRARVVALPGLWGPLDDVLARARAIAWSPASRAALDELAAIAARVAALAPGARLSLDLGLGRGFEYYTGVRFAAFAAGAADAVARGGRYDELVGRYGRATGAVGFAVDIEAIASAQRAAGLGPPEPGLGVLVVGADAPRIAAGLRGLGVRAAPHLGGPRPPPTPSRPAGPTGSTSTVDRRSSRSRPARGRRSRRPRSSPPRPGPGRPWPLHSPPPGPRRPATPSRKDEHMSVVIVVGAQWGDEGKGKVVDLYAEVADTVVRYGGGANAGHTLVIKGQKLVTHLVPSGVCHPGKPCVLGDGMVIDPRTLLDEIAALQARGLLAGGELLVGHDAHVILPYHKRIEQLREDRKGAIGTTRRGIGPAYEAKVGRRGVRIRDLFRPERLRELVAANLDELAPVMVHLGGAAPTAAEADAWIADALAAGEALRPYVGDASRFVADKVKAGVNVLFEGAQGTLLDIDHGTYPFVTSSSTIAAGACQSTGIGPSKIDRVVGITKAYATRVGAGPFPTELHGEAGEALRQAGAEFGATTGRPRRCGWLDLPALRLGVRLSGMDGLALTKLDVLAGLPEVKVCVAYRLDGRELDELPTDLDDVARAEPVFASYPGWASLAAARSFDDLPASARAYVDAVERLAGVPFYLVSVGPDRAETIVLRDPFAG